MKHNAQHPQSKLCGMALSCVTGTGLVLNPALLNLARNPCQNRLSLRLVLKGYQKA